MTKKENENKWSLFAPCPHTFKCKLSQETLKCKFDVKYLPIRLDKKKSRVILILTLLIEINH